MTSVPRTSSVHASALSQAQLLNQGVERRFHGFTQRAVSPIERHLVGSPPHTLRWSSFPVGHANLSFRWFEASPIKI